MFNSQEKQPVSQPANNSIGTGTVLEGNITTSGNLRVDGKIIGDVNTDAKMVQGEGSMIQGNIKAHSADIGGKIKGKVEVQDVLVLEPNCIIKGDIVTKRLIVESGAKFNGQCKIGGTIKDFTVDDTARDTKEISAPDKTKSYNFDPKPKTTTA